jgi:4-hydroxybenzoate polyprenyltransferase
MTSSIAAYVKLSRPFTLIAPAAGMVCWGLVAVGCGDFDLGAVWTKIALCALMAVFMNAASNGVNQIFDLDIDRINKPHRPLPAGRIGMAGAWVFTILFYLLGVGTAVLINIPTLVIVIFTVFVTYAYSGPPFRTKRWGILANITITIPRGVLLPVAGWCAVVGNDPEGALGAFTGEIWYLAGMCGLFILGAATTKDYADMKGDEAQGCISLPLRYGVHTSVKIVAPFLTLPFLMLPIGVATGILTGHAIALVVLGLGLTAWGAWVARMLLADPDAMTRSDTHPSWQHMYLLMICSQVGLAVCYLVAP